MTIVYPSNYKIITDASTEPVSLAEAKEHLRVTDSTEDTLILSLIKVAREWCELYENRLYVSPQIVSAHYPCWGDKMLLPLNPVNSISQVTYIDDNGTTQTLSSSLYSLDNYSCPAFVYPAYGALFPSVRDITNTITILYLAGYTEVPERVKHSIRLILAHLYEHRSENSEVSLSTIPFAAKNLLSDRVFI